MSNLRIAELDFDTIKTNLKNYLNQQDEFLDYDFEGSGLSILIDLLAYNTHYNAYLANMVINEMFLDSAVKRSSAVSIAKHLGYTPISVRGARAVVDITVNNPTGLPSSLVMSRYTAFSTNINGTSYTFLTNEARTAFKSGTSYLFSDVEIVEGTYASFTFVVGDNTPDAKYEIPDLNVDTSTLDVLVQTSATDTTQTSYELTSDITGLTGESKVYFLEQNSLGRYQIYFGDGIIGKQLEVGNLIVVKYIVATGTGANVSDNFTQTFTADSSIGGSNNINISVNSNSSGGADAESISSIKFNAPKFNSARNRAITSEDFKSIIQSNFTGAESIAVWGGEDNDPPYYGRVLISLKPFTGSFISDATKAFISTSILQNKSIAAIVPEFIDPDYLYATLIVNVNYNPNLTTLTPNGMTSFLTSSIENYFSENFNKFEKTFYVSKFTKYLLDLNSSLISITPELKLQKRINLSFYTENSFVGDGKIKFGTRIHPNEFNSTNFYTVYQGVQTLVYLKDQSSTNPPDYSGTGSVYLVDSNSDGFLTLVGEINYATGEITINGFTPTGYPTGQSELQLYIGLQESNYDIVTLRNQVLSLDDSNVLDASNRLQGLVVNLNTIVE